MTERQVPCGSSKAGPFLTKQCLGSSDEVRENPEHHERKGQLWALSPAPDGGDLGAGHC